MSGYFLRVMAAAKEFNIGIQTLLDFLESKGFIDLKSTSKLTEDMYITIMGEFQGEKMAKYKSNRIKLIKHDESNLSIPKKKDEVDLSPNKKIRVDLSEKKELPSEIDITVNNPKIFISYSWDNEEHTEWIISLADNLCKNGIVVLLDQYDLRAGANLTQFMEDSLKKSEKVLIIMTENYSKKADGRKGGVGYEYSIISSDFFENQKENKKYIPILRGKDKEASVPSFLRSYIYLDMTNEHEYANSFNRLVREIFEAHKIKRPKIGEIPDFIIQEKQSSR